MKLYQLLLLCLTISLVVLALFVGGVWFFAHTYQDVLQEPVKVQIMPSPLLSEEAPQ